MFQFCKRFLTMLKEACKRKGVSFLLYHGPGVFYYTYFKKISKIFVFQGEPYHYFYHIYNCTCLNERAVEIPIVWKFVKEYQGKRILEVGNVLSHYFPCWHDVLDKYEKVKSVINQDVTDFRPEKKYDLIVSISTLEHVGWDEEVKNPQKILAAIQNLKKCLALGGKVVITLPLGYNPWLDKFLEEDKIKFTRRYYLKRIQSSSEWNEVKWDEVRGIKYNSSLYTADGLVVGIIEDI